MAAFIINAISHGLLSARKRSMLPGTWTALFLLLPFCLVALQRLISANHESPATLAMMAGIGLITGPPAIILFLALGYAVYAAYTAIGR